MGMARAQRWVTCPHTRWLPLRLCLELSPPEEQQPLRPMKDPPRSRQPGAGFLSRMFAGLERVELLWVLPAGGGRRKALAWPGGPPLCFKHHPTPGRGAIYSQMSLGASESLAGLAPGGLTGPQATLLSVGSSWGAVNRDAASWSLRVARASLQRGGPRLRGFLAGDRPVPNERAESRVEAAWPFVTQPPPVSCANFLLFWQSSHMLPWFQGRGTQMPLSMGVCKE